MRASTLTVIVGLGAAVLAPASLAYSHDHERPELKAWFQNLKSKSGAACCDDGEAEHAEAVWDMAKGGYKVFLKNPANPEESGTGSTCLRMPLSNNETSMALRWCGGLHSIASMGR